jgi:hypothetical protein
LTVRAARYLRVPPWELEDVSKEWTLRALAAESCENWAEDQRDRKSSFNAAVARRGSSRG